MSRFEVLMYLPGTMEGEPHLTEEEEIVYEAELMELGERGILFYNNTPQFDVKDVVAWVSYDNVVTVRNLDVA